MERVRSNDGTEIAFDRTGSGPPVVIVLGALNDRGSGAPLAEFLSKRFTVLNYDRRGKGASGDVQPYAFEREIEDLEALIRVAGGHAHVFGHSSGAVLSLAAVARGAAIDRLALYEPPLDSRSGKTERDVTDAARIRELVAAGRRGDALEYFQRDMVGIPEEIVVQLRSAPFRPSMEAMAHTLAYEAEITATREDVAAVRIPTLVIAGTGTFQGLLDDARALAKALPNARLAILEGQTHDIVPPVLGPVLEEFFQS